MTMIGPHHVDRSSLIFYSIASLAVISQLTSTAITTTLATSSLVLSPIFPSAISASVFEIFALVTLLVAIGLFLRRVSRNLMLAAWIPTVLSGLIGSTLAITSLSFARRFKPDNAPSEGPYDQHVHSLAEAGIAVAVIGLVLQFIFWTITWPRHMQHSVLPEHEQPLSTQQVKPRTIHLRLGSIGMEQPSSFFGARQGPASLKSIASSHFTASAKSSIRNSATESLHPMTSKTRLILQTSFGSRSSRGTAAGIGSPPSRSTESEFEHWDTSRVNHSFETMKKPKMPCLEPIPGSRPASSARPLDGPFPSVTIPHETPMPIYGAFMSPKANTESENYPIQDLPRLHIRRGSTPSITSPTTPTVDQHHIHPLFRSESPAPPPLTSPGTVITASPYAGQIFTPEFALQSPRLLGSMDGSRPASPAMLSSSLSRPGSSKSSRTIPTSPFDLGHVPLPDRGFQRLATTHSRPGTPLSPNG